MITQSDVTMRTHVEMAMAQLTESQLGMLSQVQPVGKEGWKFTFVWAETLDPLASSLLTSSLTPMQIFPPAPHC